MRCLVGVGLVWGGAASAATVSIDVERASTLRIEAPFVLDPSEAGGEQVTFDGPSRAPALWTFVRVGQRLPLPVVDVTPELALGTSVLGTSWYDATPSSEIRAVGGLRVGLGGVLRPGLYGHAGWGWGTYRAPGDVVRQRENAVTVDGGGYFDVAIGGLSVGVHGGYMLFPSWWGNAHTLVAGGQLGYTF